MFKSDLITKREMTEDYCWVLQEPLIYENDKYRITVMDGFDFDFASMPWWIDGVLPKNGKGYDRAACLHDAMYAAKVFSREEADKIFLTAMLSDGVNKTIAKLIYSAVRLGGKSAYDEDEDLAKYRNLISVEALSA